MARSSTPDTKLFRKNHDRPFNCGVHHSRKHILDGRAKAATGLFVHHCLRWLLGWWLQSRSWAHQNRVRLLEVERGEASKVFDEVSRLMDKRLYRMLKLHWTLKRGASEEDVKQHLQEYREVLYEWNDALNRNLALTEAYFGPKIRAHLEGKVYEEFRRIGSQLEKRYRLRDDAAANPGWSQTAADLTGLRAQVYTLNASMIDSIRVRQSGLVESELRRPEPAAPKSKASSKTVKNAQRSKTVKVWSPSA